jgi:hypothetical protein
MIWIQLILQIQQLYLSRGQLVPTGEGRNGVIRTDRSPIVGSKSTTWPPSDTPAPDAQNTSVSGCDRERTILTESATRASGGQPVQTRADQFGTTSSGETLIVGNKSTGLPPPARPNYARKSGGTISVKPGASERRRRLLDAKETVRLFVPWLQAHGITGKVPKRTLEEAYTAFAAELELIELPWNPIAREFRRLLGQGKMMKPNPERFGSRRVVFSVPTVTSTLVTDGNPKRRRDTVGLRAK